MHSVEWSINSGDRYYVKWKLGGITWNLSSKYTNIKTNNKELFKIIASWDLESELIGLLDYLGVK